MDIDLDWSEWIIVIGNDGRYQSFDDLAKYNATYFSLYRECKHLFNLQGNTFLGFLSDFFIILYI